MKVLSIGLDKKLFEPNSAVLERLKMYAELFETMTVIVLTRKKFAKIETGNLHIYATGSRCRFMYFFDVLKLVSKIIKKEKHDVITTQDPFDTGIFGWLIKVFYGIPWQCQIHGDIFSPFFKKESILNKIRVIFAKSVLPKADGIRVVSQRIKNSLESNVHNLKTIPVVLPIFTDIEKLQKTEIKINLKEKYPQFDFILLSASRLSKEKNIKLQIKALAKLVKTYPKIGLIVVGEGGEKEELELLVKKYQLQGNLFFEPWSSNLASYYKTADVFLLTSNYEGWGMTIIEAAACGCPVIMTDVGCAGEFIKNEESGIIIKVGDLDTLVSNLKRFIDNKSIGEKLVNNAKFALTYLPDKNRYLQIYKELLEAIKIN